MFAVIKTGGKQYVVKEGDLLDVEKLGLEAGRKLLFDQVLLIDDGGTTLVGTPLVANACVKAGVVEDFKDDKILVFKKKRRKQFRRTRGHRQQLTKVKIEKIIPDRASASSEDLDVESFVAPPAAPEPKAEAPAPAAKKKAPAEPTAEKPKSKRAEKPAPKPKAKPKAAKK